MNNLYLIYIFNNMIDNADYNKNIFDFKYIVNLRK